MMRVKHKAPASTMAFQFKPYPPPPAPAIVQQRQRQDNRPKRDRIDCIDPADGKAAYHCARPQPALIVAVWKAMELRLMALVRCWRGTRLGMSDWCRPGEGRRADVSAGEQIDDPQRVAAGKNWRRSRNASNAAAEFVQMSSLRRLVRQPACRRRAQRARWG